MQKACVILCCHLRPVCFYHIFSRYPISDTIFAKDTEKKCVLVFFTTFVWNISYSKTNQARYSHKAKWPSFFSGLTKTLISLKDFRKILKCQINWKSVQGEPSCSKRTDARTNRHDEATSNNRFSEFYESA